MPTTDSTTAGQHTLHTSPTCAHALAAPRQTIWLYKAKSELETELKCPSTAELGSRCWPSATPESSHRRSLARDYGDSVFRCCLGRGVGSQRSARRPHTLHLQVMLRVRIGRRSWTVCASQWGQ